MRGLVPGPGLSALAAAGLLVTLGLATVMVEPVGTAALPTTGPEVLVGGAIPRTPILPQEDEEPYDGHYTFVRVRFGEEGGGGLGGFGGGWGRRREPDWAHDWDRAENNFLTILEELTYVSPTPGNGRILRFDDPEIFRYPVAYVVEVGSWRPNETEISNLGEWLRKGGFLIVDDFRGEQLYQLRAILGTAIPEVTIQEVPDDHSIFDSFFRIEDPHALLPPTFQQYRPYYLGLFEDDDPYGRIMVMMNYNNDIAEYWETSGTGWALIDMENEAFKFGVNYVIYALTH